MWLESTEHGLTEGFGRVKSLKILWVRITDGLEQLGSNAQHLVVGRNSEERREGGEIWNVVLLGESGHVTANERIFAWREKNSLSEIDDFQERREISWRVRGDDARAPVRRVGSGEIHW